MQPVIVYLTINVPANGASPSVPQNVPTEGGNNPAVEVPTSTTAPDSKGPDQSTEHESPLLPPDHIVQGSAPVPQDKGEMSPVEKALVGLVLAERAKESIDRSDTWEAVVGRIKWLMDTLSPVAGVRASFIVSFLN